MQVGQNIFNHTNTFENGMYKDTSLLLQPDGTYRHLRNFQLINHDGNNYTIRDVLGNRLIFTLPKAYNSIAGLPPVVTYQTAPMPIGFISFPDKLIVFSTNNDTSNGGYGEIGILYLTNIGESVEYDPQSITVGAHTWIFNGYVPLYHHVDLKFSRWYKIEGFGFPENDNIARVYWTDNFNQPRVLDTLQSTYTNYKATGDLIVGQQYMVLTGAITHNAVIYGPGIGNIFTAANVNYSVTDGQPLVIPYYDIELLNWQPDRDLGDIRFDSFGNGNCYCGNRMYFYRFKSSSAGSVTGWSYGMFPVHVGLNQNPNPTINSQHNYVGAGTSTSLVDSGKSVKIIIDNIDTKYNTIELACAEFDQTIEIPYAIKIVVSVAITGTTMTLEDFGNINLGNLTLDDITLFPANILKVKTITTNKNYNIIANITERQEFTSFDISTIALSDSIFQMPADNESSAACANTITFGGYATPINPTVGVNPPLLNSIQQATKWVVTVGTAEYPAGSGNFYTVGQVFTGNAAFGAGYKNWAQTTVGAQIRPATFLKQYTPFNSPATQRYDIQEIKTFTGWDYRNPSVASMAKGYRSSEKYRFGILFYDKKGNPFYVRWIGDHTFDSIYTKDGLLKPYDVLGDQWWVLQANLLNVSGLKIPKNIVDQIDGFSIVRAECDPTIITQGLCWQTQVNTGVSPFRISPLPSVTLTNGNGHSADPGDHVYSFLCPDDLVNDVYVSSKLMSVGDTMKVVGWLEPGALSAGGYFYKSTSFSTPPKYEWATKLYQHIDATNTSYDNESTVQTFLRFNEGDTASNFVPGNDFYNRDMWTGVSSYTIDTVCIGGGIADMNNVNLIGSKKIAVKTAADFDTYDLAAGIKYSDPSGANANDPKKCLVNYIIPNGNQYGGTGAAALAATLYISTGHYQKIDSTVIADNCDTNNPVSYNYLQFDNIQVGGGDTFVCIVDQGYGLFDSGYPLGGSYGIMFPCETRVNYNLRRGRKISDFGMHLENQGVSYNGGVGSNGPEDYQYNDAYGSEGNAFKYPALPVDFNGALRYPTRARFAGQKIIGELIDSFRTFLTNDYRDVDAQLGEINNLMARSDYVYYWQNHGVGSMPILERLLQTGNSPGVTSLGTGGVLTRFDTISTKYGNQHQWGLIPTEYGWIWFDMRNKDVCIMGFGGATQEITVPTGMKSYFSEVFLERLTALYNDTYLNSQTYAASSDRPLMGTGIIGVYDPKNKMSYLTFKFRSYYKIADPPTIYTDYQVINKDFTIGFSHIINKFIGFYDKYPAIWHNHNQSVLSANNPKNLEIYYAADMVVPTPVELGDLIKDGIDEYICTTTGIISVYASPPSASLFTKINDTSQIYIENEEKAYSTIINGYEVDKFYGRAVDNEIQFVVNPKTDQGFSVDWQTDVGNTANFNNFYYNTETKSTEDLNVKSWNRDYQLIDEGWNHNLPISTTGKLSGFYMLTKYVKKNWTTTPTVITTSIKLLQRVKSFFKLRY